jgi:nucleoside 2-deoxyribosyltransferase
MNKPRVYLAGPIAGLSYEAAVDWRAATIEALAPTIVGVSPMRGVDYLPQGYSVVDEHTAKGITARDRFDIMTSDAVLMNVFGAKKVSIGSMIEAGWADAFRKPLVLVMEEDNIHFNALLVNIAGWIVPTLDEGIDIIKTIFEGKHIGKVTT